MYYIKRSNVLYTLDDDIDAAAAARDNASKIQSLSLYKFAFIYKSHVNKVINLTNEHLLRGVYGRAYIIYRVYERTDKPEETASSSSTSAYYYITVRFVEVII